ncbi:hypothetical protein D9757_012338 [Collybiopsis confluens]|uniref:Cytochrome P450 n=1 Tax=Collybiopsis confluens TaxID=2823264 RepID=A0A8H5FYQ9_9AGAR|nr:hypothetical protein D9757_012338 [Collybiopsis confluens]
MALSILHCSLAVVVVVILCHFLRQIGSGNTKRRSLLPPGPPRKPLVGNLFDIPREKAWLQFTQWHGQYGDLVYMEVLGKSILVLNSIKAVNDLLVDRASLYSDRPTFTMVGELMGLENSIPLLPYGPTLRQHRKLCHLSLSPEAVKKYHRIQEDATVMYLQQLVDTPQTFVEQLRLTAGRIIMSVTYGIPPTTPDDVYIVEAEETMEMIGKSTVPGAHLVDLLPFLRILPSWLPFNSIHSVARAGRDLIWSMISRPFEAVKANRSKGTARPSFTLDCLESFETDTMGLSPQQADHLIRWAAGAMYGAGGESTYATILTFMVAMVKFPDVQKKLQEEIDGVVGRDRLPVIQDRPNLPYVNATIKEALRWRPALPLSIARKLKHDDFYEGYFIPEGTIVMPNIWTISTDDRSGIPSDQFAPERFLQQHVKEPALDPMSVCPGRHLGENNLFLLISGLSASVDLSLPIDSRGVPMSCDPGYTSGLVSHPKPYELNIAPRSPEISAMIKERASHTPLYKSRDRSGKGTDKYTPGKIALQLNPVNGFSGMLFKRHLTDESRDHQFARPTRRALSIMLIDATVATLGMIVVGLVIVIWRQFHHFTTRASLPPGPYVDAPPKSQPWKAYRQWSQDFAALESPLIYFKVRGRHVIVNNNLQVALDLLENRNRSLNYSSRPDFPMMNLIGRQDNVGFQRYGPRLKKCRKLLHDALSVRSIPEWIGRVQVECDSLLAGLLRKPHGVESAVHRFVGSIIVQFTYGQELDAEYLRLVEETSKHSTAAMIPGKWAVDSYPFLKHLPAWAPGGIFQIWAADAKKLFETFTQKPFQRVKEHIKNGAVIPSFVYNNLINILDDGSTEEEAILAGTAASLYSAATDTTSTFLLTFFLTMVLYPEIQEKAYQEISRVVGDDRFPVLSDEASLPYIQSIIKELHRFNPPVPLMPRSPAAEDIYEGVRIPSKSWMFTNIWAMTHDEKDYPCPDPAIFAPERFLGEEGLKLRDPRDISFGFGRRRCPGITFANTVTFLVITRTLAAFRIDPVRGSNGEPLLPPLEFVTAFTTPPKEVKCMLVPRSKIMVDMIKNIQSLPE